MHDRQALHALAAALGGLPVLGCRPNSPAARAGVRYGDIVLSVNGVPTQPWELFVEARGRDKQLMVVEIFRDGAHLTFRVPLESTPIDMPTLLAELIAENLVPLEAEHVKPASEPN